MAKENLTFASIANIPNGEDAITNFDKLIRVCAMDCAERPDIKKPRKLMMQLSFEPDDNSIVVGIAVKHALPQQDSGLARGNLDRSGKLIVNPASADEPGQATLDEAGGDEA